MKALFDTNVLVDYLNGVADAREELARYENASISVITWMEIMVGANADSETATRRFLASFDRLGVTEAVGERAVTLRRTMKLRLPDAIILATAQVDNLLLVTRNTKDFNADLPGIRVPYRR